MFCCISLLRFCFLLVVCRSLFRKFRAPLHLLFHLLSCALACCTGVNLSFTLKCKKIWLETLSTFPVSCPDNSLAKVRRLLQAEWAYRNLPHLSHVAVQIFCVDRIGLESVVFVKFQGTVLRLALTKENRVEKRKPLCVFSNVLFGRPRLIDVWLAHMLSVTSANATIVVYAHESLERSDKYASLLSTGKIEEVAWHSLVR